MIGALRFLLALLALLIITIDPSEPDRYVLLTYFTLVSYTVYSGLLYLLLLTERPVVFHYQDSWAHWVDVGWYALLVALSSGTNSIFFFGFFFPILVSSFRHGFRSGMAVSIVSAGLFTLVGITLGPTETEFHLNRFLLRPTYLLVLGYMLARWGEFEGELKRRLALLRDITTISNPRFGLTHTLSRVLERLRDFYDADQCLLLHRVAKGAGYQLRCAQRGNPEAALSVQTLPAGLLDSLAAFPPQLAALYQSPRRWRKLHHGFYHAIDLESGSPSLQGKLESRTLADRLEINSFLTAPVPSREMTEGRLYLTGCRRVLTSSDLEFLVHVAKQLAPVIDNIGLVDRLASTAAEEERRRIARDIHDSIIQPYIGLQMGLAGLRKKITHRDPELATDTDRLLALTETAIADLRRYVGDLKNPGGWEGNLLSAVKRFASRYQEVTGIRVQVQSESSLPAGDRLAAEVFQMVVEGLSNVRRHTDSAQACVRLSSGNGQLVLEIENENRRPCSQFLPRSISERAAALGGTTRVLPVEGQKTTVIVEIPL